MHIIITLDDSADKTNLYFKQYQITSDNKSSSHSENIFYVIDEEDYLKDYLQVYNAE